MKKILTLLTFAGVATSAQAIQLTFDAPTSPAIVIGDIVDGYDASGPQLSTDYTGGWSDSDTLAEGFWTLSVTDFTATSDLVFVQTPSIVNFSSITDGQGLQFIVDGTAGGTGEEQATTIAFSYTVTDFGTASPNDFGTAFAVGPHGQGFIDNTGGYINTGGEVFDATAGVAAPVYDSVTGLFSTTPETTAASSSVNHDWTIVFEGQQSVTYEGTLDDVDTFVFGIGVPEANYTAVPEPSSTALLGLGSLALAARRRRNA
ncbi:PEP-CTERM sorting domain-containing protein [Rubritalea sp.]|uniref:PEP-CTERM sorting domain-containing protein n=1 Tax=Rubritalea sp. TaxID=2109375 RepID=UPI003EF1029C